MTAAVTIYGASPQLREQSSRKKITNGRTEVATLPTIDETARVTDNAAQPLHIAAEDATQPMTITPPYSTDFSTDVANYSVVDANGDGSTWVMTSDGVIAYNYSWRNDANDWLLSPGINLEAGKRYELALDAMSAMASYPNDLEIRLGAGATASTSQLDIEVMPITEIGTFKRHYATFQVPESGVYRLGFHAVSAANTSDLYLLSYSISGGMGDDALSQARNITVTPAQDASLRATISFDLPTTTISGATAGTVTNVDVYNVISGQSVVSLPNPSSHVTLFDSAPVNGFNTYEIVCSNASGRGVSASVTAWVGLDLPTAPQNVHWDFEENGITTLITWDAPAALGINGLPIDADNLTYTIYGYAGSNANMVATMWTSRSVDSKVYLKRRQDPAYYVVYPATDQGGGMPGVSNIKLCGTPYTLPFGESFAQTQAGTIGWLTSRDHGVNSAWTIFDIADNFTSQDEDMGMLVFTADDVAPGACIASSPLLDMRGSVTPVLEFSYIHPDATNTLEVVVSTDRGETYVPVQTISTSNAWTRTSVALSPYADEPYLIVGFRATNTGDGSQIGVDKIYVGDNVDTDLKVATTDGGRSVHYAGHESNILVTVLNNGKTAVSADWSAAVFVDDHMAGTISGQALESGASTVLTIPYTSHASHAGMTPEVRIIHDSDQYTLNNSALCSFQIEESWLPAPMMLMAQTEDNTVQLNWTAPSTTPIAPPAVEKTYDFEDYESWSVGDLGVYKDSNGVWHQERSEGTLGDFKIIDGDGLKTTAVAVAGNYPTKMAPMAWGVYDSMYPTDITVSQPVHSGSKALVAMSATTNEATDDWLILPRLGDNKIISFWARSFAANWGLEEFEIWVSSTGDNRDDFTKFGEKHDVPANAITDSEHGFTFFEFELPADTEYVAIRHISKWRFGMLLDDLTFTPAADEAKSFVPTSYNVYKNNRRVNTSVVSSRNWNELNVESGAHTYAVSAVYTEGESSLSPEAYVSITVGVDELNATGIARVADKRIVALVEGLSIYRADGTMLRTLRQGESIAPGAGVYILTDRHQNFKIVL